MKNTSKIKYELRKVPICPECNGILKTTNENWYICYECATVINKLNNKKT